jgi:hypothetical protein
MCIIAIYEKAFPTSEQLIDMESMNQDLGGIAWIDGGFVHWKKGISAKEMITMIKKGIVKLPLIVHFRISSSGGHTKDGFLNHPFLCSAKGTNKTEGKSKTLPLVFHNGTWGEWSSHLLKSIQATGDKIPDGKMSDTRAMSYLIAKHGINYSMFFENQKIAIMTPKEIIRFGQWYDLKAENTIVSNTFWQNKNEAWGNFSFGDMQLMSQGKKPTMDKYKPKLSHKVNAGIKQNLPDINTKKSKKRLKEIEDKISSHGVEMLRPKEIFWLRYYLRK